MSCLQCRIAAVKLKSMTKLSIICVWLFGSLFTILAAAFAHAEFLDMRLMLPVSMSVIAVGFSIFHPGGWLSIGGLIWALRKRSLKPLWLSIAGAVLTGLSVPMLEAIGAAAL